MLKILYSFMYAVCRNPTSEADCSLLTRLAHWHNTGMYEFKTFNLHSTVFFWVDSSGYCKVAWTQFSPCNCGKHINEIWANLGFEESWVIWQKECKDGLPHKTLVDCSLSAFEPFHSILSVVKEWKRILFLFSNMSVTNDLSLRTPKTIVFKYMCQNDTFLWQN